MLPHPFHEPHPTITWLADLVASLPLSYPPSCSQWSIKGTPSGSEIICSLSVLWGDTIPKPELYLIHRYVPVIGPATQWELNKCLAKKHCTCTIILLQWPKDLSNQARPTLPSKGPNLWSPTPKSSTRLGVWVVRVGLGTSPWREFGQEDETRFHSLFLLLPLRLWIWWRMMLSPL